MRAITPFKVIQCHRGRYQSKARMRLPISYCFGVIADYCSNFGHCVFEHPFGGGGLGLIRTRVEDFLEMLIELISLGVTAEALQAKIDFASTPSL